MPDMTIGQRIAAERKKRGLSQEALGEKMGVSRQAISKWESDAAVPEIDKFIAMSKLFGVTVGWLLGVEDAPAEQTDTLSEKQLQVIEEIVKKYQPRQSKWKPLLASILIGILAAALLWVGTQQERIQARVASNETRFLTLQAQVNNNQSQLESRIDAAQTAAQTPALLADYTLEIVGIVSGDAPQAEIAFSAVPNNWQQGDSAALSLRRDGMATKTVSCAWDGAFLTARTFLNVADGYELCLALTHDDGTQDQQVLNAPDVRNLKQTLTITAEATSGRWFYENSTLTLKNYEFQISMPLSGQFYGSLLWETVDLILTTGSGEELGRYSLLNAMDEEDQNVLKSSDIWMKNAEIRFVDLDIQKNEGILLWLSAETNNGLTVMEPVSAWAADADGKLRTQ